MSKSGKIITITFSPCIDKSTTVTSLISEKKLQCTLPILEPGGGGINVARAIQKLGGQATAIYPSGGYTGRFFNHLLEDESVDSIVIDTKAETRENFIVVEESTNKQYRFGMPGSYLLEEEWLQIISAIDTCGTPEFIVASGSLPPGVPKDIYAKLAKIAKSKKAKFIVDTSGPALQSAVEEGVYLLKPNLGELAFLSGVEYLNEVEVGEAAIRLISLHQCEVVVVSMGAKGALLVTKNERLLISPPPVQKRSTVGAGDSMVGGIVYSLSKGNILKEAVSYGVACGTAATMNAGSALCKKEDADVLYDLMRKH